MHDAQRSGDVCLSPGRCADVHSLAAGAVHAQYLDRLVIRRTEPVRHAGIELGNFALAHCDVVLAQDESHLPGQHVQPFVPFMRTELAFPRGRNDHFPHLQTARLLGKGEDHAPVADAWLQPDARVADLGRADQFVERHLIHRGER